MNYVQRETCVFAVFCLLIVKTTRQLHRQMATILVANFAALSFTDFCVWRAFIYFTGFFS